MFNEFLIRIGTFGILIGIGVFILFVASDAAGKTNFDYLFWAMLSVTLGIMLRRRKAPPPPSGRFASLRGMRDRSRRDKEDK